MKNRNRNEPRSDERVFEGVIERALQHQQNESIDTAQHRSAIYGQTGQET